MEKLTDFIKLIVSANTLSEISDVIQDIREYLGFEHTAFVMQLPTAFNRADNILLGNYSRIWLDRYSERGYIKIDPVIEHCLSSQLPYCWKELAIQSDELVKQFVEDACDHGLCGGVSIGRKGFDGTTSLLSMVVPHQLDSSDEQYSKAVLCMNAILPSLHEKVASIAYEGVYHKGLIALSQREKDCLRWVAEGKTSFETAQILAITEATIVFHLKNVIRKLDVSNRNQAISKAVQLGIIHPEFPVSPKF